MKKRLALFLLLTALLSGFAESVSAITLNISFSDGYVSVFDAMTLIAAVLFFLGMIFILSALFAGTGKQSDKAPVQPEKISPKAPENSRNIIELSEDAPVDAEAQETEAGSSAPETSETETESSAPENAENQQKSCSVTITGINSKEVFTFSILPGGTYTVGRKEENDITISDSTVSGKHCTFSLPEDGLYITDEHSTNGTKINGTKITEPHKIQTGDVISIGCREFRIGI